jgi:O-antigen/teichoic acid export membrane protein
MTAPVQSFAKRVPALRARLREASLHDRRATTQVVGRALALALNLVTFAVLLRSLGPAEYGKVALAQAVAGGLSLLATFGVDQMLLRDLSLAPDDRQALAEGFLSRAIIALIIAAIYLAVVLLVPFESSMRAPLAAAAAVVLVSPLTAFHQVLRSRVDLRPVAIADVAGSIAALAAVAVLTGVGALTPAAAVLAIALANGLSWLGVAVVARRRLRLSTSAVQPGFVWRRLRPAMAVGIGSVLVFGYGRGDVFVLAASASATALGLYTAAFRFLDVGIYAPLILVGAYFPAIARALGNKHALDDVLTRAGTRLLVIGGCVYVVGTLFGASALAVLGGSAYRNVGPVVGLLMAALALMFVNTLLLQTLLAGGWTKAQLMAYVAATAVAVVIGVPLILEFAAIGAAAATLLAEVAIVVVAGRMVASRSGWSPPAYVCMVVLAACAGATAVAVAAPPAVWRAVAAGVLCATMTSLAWRREAARQRAFETDPAIA